VVYPHGASNPRYITLWQVGDFPIERSRGDTPLRISELELETQKMPRANTALWPTTKQRVVLWALAALAAIIIGVIPALWINRWRAGTPTQSSRPPAQPQAAGVERVEAQPDETVEVAQPAGVAQPEQAVQPTVPAATESALAPAPASSPAKTIKPTRSRPERPKQTPSARKQPPPCDVYLYPKGCPN
jgi:outer membrane biosynthesis protein TonB